MNNDKWVLCDMKLDKQIKNTNADTAKSDQDEDAADVFDDNNMIEKWKKIHLINRIAN